MFAEINELPILLNIDRLDEGDGIESTLTRNKAKYHKSCRFLFSNAKLERVQMRAQKRTSDLAEDDANDKESNQYDVRRPRRSQISQDLCFICEEENVASPLRETMTMKVNERLNECARNLGDRTLLAKLSAGDVVALEFKYHLPCLNVLYNKERAHLNALKREQNPLRSASENVHHSVFSVLVHLTSVM